jgi:hypothetical protein
MEADATRYNIARGICYSPANKDGCIVLNVHHDSILSLNSTGAFIFEKLASSQSGMTRDELLKAVIPAFDDVHENQIDSAIGSLLAQLEQKRVLRKEARPLTTWAHSQFVKAASVCVSATVNLLLKVKAHTAAALLMLTSVDAILKIGGFKTLHVTVKTWKVRHRSSHDPQLIVDGCDAVERACVWHPKQKLCLQKSAAATCLLRSVGIPAEMVIGVHKMPFYGHCWVEVDGRVVNDHKNVQTFFHVLARC